MSTTPADFRQHWGDLDALRWLVAESLKADTRRVASRSRETTTHYKWLLASERNRQARVWLHEFKPERERRSGYAATVHNHRYGFSVVALTGSYTNKRYHVLFENDTLQVLDREILSCHGFSEGATYSMEPDEYHCIDDIEDGTQTLVMEFAPAAASSFSVDLSGERMIQHTPLEVRVNHLLNPRTESSSTTDWRNYGYTG